MVASPSLPGGSQVYTPIAIQFKPWALNQDNSALGHTEGVKYRLRITSPRSNRKGQDQYIADSLILDVPPDGLLRFQLLPSDKYLPIGRYQAEFFRVGNRTPLDVQTWVVPSVPMLNQYFFALGDQDPVLPLKVWRVLSVSAGDNWVAEYNSLTWRFGRPALGTDITVDYQPAATLDMLQEYKTGTLGNVERMRN